MIQMINFGTILYVTLAISLPGDRFTRQETRLEVFDQVSVPGEWTGTPEGDWYFNFWETWEVYPERPALEKYVDTWFPRNDHLGDLPADSMKSVFTALLTGNPDFQKGNHRSSILYEFVLLEPHAAGAGLTGFTAPDSMDPETRRLQEALIRLVEQTSESGSRFNLKEQLLSVWFSEIWMFDPATMEITREVRSITPVIWQRRRTTGGELIDEPVTGYPVYYKNQLQPVVLRNP